MLRPDPDGDRFPSRKHPRLKNFDYASTNYYFITVCTWNKECIFGKPGKPNEKGSVAEELLLQIESHFVGVRVDKYVVMPNHVHMILALEGSDTAMTQMVGQYKSSVTRVIRKIFPEQKVWQTSFHDHIIRNQKDYERIWLYIDANPQNWSKDCFYQDV